MQRSVDVNTPVTLTENLPGDLTETATQRMEGIRALEFELAATRDQLEMLDLAMAVATSIQLSMLDRDRYPLVWLIFDGPPSCGKTFTVRLLNQYKEVVYRDKLTAAGAKGAFVNPKTGRGIPGLMDELNGRCLILKELAATFSIRSQELQSLMGTLQGAFDGEYDAQTGTVGHQHVDASFSLLGCGTPDVLDQHRTAMAAIGPRFLYLRIPNLTREQAKGLAAARKGIRDAKGKVDDLRALIAGHLRQLPPPPPELPDSPWEVDALGALLTQGRASPQWLRLDEGDRELIGVTIEDPARVTQQLNILGLSLARLYGRASIGPAEVSRLSRVVLSSIPLDRARVLWSLASGAATREEVCKLAGLAPSTINRVLGMLGDAGLVEQVPATSPTQFVVDATFRSLVWEPAAKAEYTVS